MFVCVGREAYVSQEEAEGMIAELAQWRQQRLCKPLRKARGFESLTRLQCGCGNKSTKASWYVAGEISAPSQVRALPSAERVMQ